MTYAISHFFPGGTQDQYEAVMIALNGKLGVIPKGQIFHVAGPTAGGWQIVGVQDSKESWDAFLTDLFYPIMGKGVKGGLTAPPTETVFEVSHFYQ